MKFTIILILGIFIFPYQSNPWISPKEADNLKNPCIEDGKSIKRGKKIYHKVCWSCHGATGLGDGPAAQALDPKPASFRTNEFHIQTDGAIFWKLTTGRGLMASYKSTLSEKNRWDLVNYLRTLKN